jgi:hypothetical protein
MVYITSKLSFRGKTENHDKLHPSSFPSRVSYIVNVMIFAFNTFI